MITNNKHNPVKYVRCIQKKDGKICGHVSGLDSNQEGRQKYWCPICMGSYFAHQAIPITEEEFINTIKEGKQ